MSRAMTQAERDEKYPQRRFQCAYCFHEVITENASRECGIDKRTRFCCEACQVKYWKHPKRNATRLTNMYKNQAFRDVNKYDE